MPFASAPSSGYVSLSEIRAWRGDKFRHSGACPIASRPFLRLDTSTFRRDRADRFRWWRGDCPGGCASTAHEPSCSSLSRYLRRAVRAMHTAAVGERADDSIRIVSRCRRTRARRTRAWLSGANRRRRTEHLGTIHSGNLTDRLGDGMRVRCRGGDCSRGRHRCGAPK